MPVERVLYESRESAVGSPVVGRLVTEGRKTLRRWLRRPLGPGAMILVLGLGIAGVMGVADTFLSLLSPRLGVAAPGTLFWLEVHTEDLAKLRLGDETVSKLQRVYGEGIQIAFARGTLASVTWKGVANVEHVATVSSNYAAVVGLKYVLGSPSNQPSVVLQAAYASSGQAGPTRLGDIRVDDRTYPVSGVLSSKTNGPDPMQPPAMFLVDPDFSGGASEALVRLAPGLDRMEAQQILLRLAKGAGLEKVAAVRLLPVDSPMGDAESRAAAAIGGGALGALALLFLIGASVNLVTLLWSRWRSREGEFRIRMALGASATEIVTLGFVEGAFVIALGGSLGWYLARVLRAGILSWLPGGAHLPSSRPDQMALVVIVALACPIALALMFAVKQRHVLMGGEKVVAQGGWTLGVQVFTAMCLLSTGLYFTRTIERLSHLDRGYDPKGLVTFTLQRQDLTDLPLEGAIAQLEKAFLSSHSVEDVAVIDRILFPFPPAAPLSLPGDDRPRIRVGRAAVSDRYFSAMRTKLLRGDAFSASVIDEPSIVLSRAAAEALGGNVLGRSVLLADSTFRVIGVSADGTYGGAGVRPMAFTPLAADVRRLVVVVRGKSGNVAPRTIRGVVSSISGRPQLPEVVPVTEWFDRSWLLNRAVSAFTTLLALAAMLVAIVGILAAASHTAHLRRRQVATRVAVGSPPLRAALQELNSVLKPSGMGLLYGCSAVLVLGFFVRGVGGGGVELVVSSMTLSTLAVAAAVLMGVAGPIRKALQSRPAEVLKDL